MADEIIRLDYSAEDIGDNIDEVRTARGEYDSLDERLDEIEGGGFTPTQAQLDAINSGITDDDVEQIDLNKNNILSIYDTGNKKKNVMRIVLDEVKALLPSQPFVGNTTIFGNLSVTFNEDNSITLNGSHTAAVAINFKDLSHINMPTDAVGAASANITLSNDIFFGLWGDSGVSNLVLNDGVDIPSDYASKYSRGFVIRVSANTVCNNVRIYPMVCDKALYQASSEVVSYAFSNAAITPALQECVDNGVKNLLQFHSNTNGELVATAQSNGYSVIITGGDDAVGKTVAYADCTIEKTGNYTFRCDLSGNGASCYIYDVTTGTQMREYYATSSETLTLTGGHTYQIRTYHKGSGINATVEAMICEKSLYDVSSIYQPYALSNAELTAKEQVNENNILSGFTMVAHASANGATSLSYDTNINDFNIGGANSDKSSGSYLVICTNWSTTPAPYVGLLTFSGATGNKFVKTDIITGFAPTITITQNVANATIDISGAAKISIYATK